MNRLIHGDCGDVDLPEADLLLTDPPYGISKDSSFSKKGDKRYHTKALAFGAWDFDPPAPEELAQLADRTLRKGGTAIIFYDLWKTSDLARALTTAGFSKLRLIVWTKTNPVPVNAKASYLSNAREFAVCGVKGKVKATFNSYYDAGNYSYPLRDGQKNLHPTQKPLAFMEALVAKHSKEGDLVVDPYCGSGTTLLAAQRLNRRWVGVEKDEGYCEIARKRLLEATKTTEKEAAGGLI